MRNVMHRSDSRMGTDPRVTVHTGRLQPRCSGCPSTFELENVMKKLVAVVALALSAASLSAVAMINTDRHGETASPAASECTKPWACDRAPFGRCPARCMVLSSNRDLAVQPHDARALQ